MSFISVDVGIFAGTTEASAHGGGGGLTDFVSSGYEVMMSVTFFKTKFPSLLIHSSWQLCMYTRMYVCVNVCIFMYVRRCWHCTFLLIQSIKIRTLCRH